MVLDGDRDEMKDENERDLLVWREEGVEESLSVWRKEQSRLRGTLLSSTVPLKEEREGKIWIGIDQKNGKEEKEEWNGWSQVNNLSICK